MSLMILAWKFSLLPSTLGWDWASSHTRIVCFYPHEYQVDLGYYYGLIDVEESYWLLEGCEWRTRRQSTDYKQLPTLVRCQDHLYRSSFHHFDAIMKWCHPDIQPTAQYRSSTRQMDWNRFVHLFSQFSSTFQTKVDMADFLDESVVLRVLHWLIESLRRWPSIKRILPSFNPQARIGKTGLKLEK